MRTRLGVLVRHILGSVSPRLMLGVSGLGLGALVAEDALVASSDSSSLTTAGGIREAKKTKEQEQEQEVLPFDVSTEGDKCEIRFPEADAWLRSCAAANGGISVQQLRKCSHLLLEKTEPSVAEVEFVLNVCLLVPASQRKRVVALFPLPVLLRFLETVPVAVEVVSVYLSMYLLQDPGLLRLLNPYVQALQAGFESDSVCRILRSMDAVELLIQDGLLDVVAMIRPNTFLQLLRIEFDPVDPETEEREILQRTLVLLCKCLSPSPSSLRRSMDCMKPWVLSLVDNGLFEELCFLLFSLERDPLSRFVMEALTAAVEAVRSRPEFLQILFESPGNGILDLVLKITHHIAAPELVLDAGVRLLETAISCYKADSVVVSTRILTEVLKLSRSSFLSVRCSALRCLSVFCSVYSATDAQVVLAFVDGIKWISSLPNLEANGVAQRTLMLIIDQLNGWCTSAESSRWVGLLFSRYSCLPFIFDLLETSMKSLILLPPENTQTLAALAACLLHFLSSATRVVDALRDSLVNDFDFDHYLSKMSVALESTNPYISQTCRDALQTLTPELP
ncbi:putative mitochondrial protein [Andalucia godoyi]|uniref:Putative mitochondrial protein n=1 Tax=Andalucia godoyi TaxID=505711 RepID=A0A8K0F2Y7_ANDGO|nr:putative mitochondrial protein [Andalucia godoyi]|eukprot:ANDGO_07528.mRNA.1 putative mitochondrial protein